MLKTRNLIVVAFAIFLIGCKEQRVENSWASYSKDPVIEAKVDSVLSLMTLEEKIGQMSQFSGHTNLTGLSKNDDFRTYLDQGLVGSIFNVFSTEALRKIQEHAISKSRLNIPVLFAADVIHGYKTTFPIPLAEACSWDTDLMERSARIAAVEATAAGISWNFAPMVDIARDPRWGRVMEGAGEDVYLGNLVAAARVKGFQGINDYTDFANPNTLVACVKHFAAYGAAEAGRDYNTVDISDRKLREIYLPPFKAAVDAGVGSFMTAFNEIAGVPCTGSRYLYTDILRGEWDFRGAVVTDYTAIFEMVDHGYAADLKDAGEKSLNAGIDMDMKSTAFIKHLVQSVEEGKVDISAIDQAAARVLELKFMLGLFDDPYRYMDAEREKRWVGAAEHKEEALLNAQRSIVLLKNEKQLLPLPTTSKSKVALIGPMIKERRSLNGEWAIVGDRKESVTIFEGLTKEYADSNVKFDYARGCGLEADANLDGVKEAVKVAKRNDIIIVALGEDYNWSGEAASRTDIKLPEPQQELLKELKKTGKPIVLLLLNGRPLDLSWEDENVEAIVETWYLGIKAGDAIADVISGAYNPSGKLTLTFPRNVGQIPIYYNRKNTGRPYVEGSNSDYRSSYRDVSNTPLYPFGYGLSYTKFEYSNLKLDKSSINFDEEITVSIDIKNIGSYDGEEIVQLYIRDLVGSVTRPLKELKGFSKIMLKKGESKNVKFTISSEDLAFYDIDMNYTAEAGKFEVFVGANSYDNSNKESFTLSK